MAARKRTVTSHTYFDQMLIDAMTPVARPSLAEVLDKAQYLLNNLRHSKFFKRYIADLIAEFGHGHAFFILAKHDQREFLVLTDKYQLRCVFSGNPKTYALAEIMHEDMFVSKAVDVLVQMNEAPNLIRYLYSHFSEPRFTAEDIQAEMKRNGPVQVVFITRNYEEGDTDQMDQSQLIETLTRLQFEVVPSNVDISKVKPSDLIVPENGQAIFVLDWIGSNEYHLSEALYRQLPPAVKQRLVNVASGATFVGDPLISELSAIPRYQWITGGLHPRDLLAQLDTMFAH